MIDINNLFISIRKYLMKKIIDNKCLVNLYENEKQLLLNLIKLTVVNGESNSALLIGPKECGKTTLMKSVIKSLDQNINLESNCMKIELNGLIHTDDKLALKSCTAQMNLENLVEGKVFNSFADNLTYLLDCLRSGQQTTFKCLLFVIEEFDLFCFHDNQTLLYNLLDMTHNSEIPICVIGITTRLDVVELFEKRVKSRFSHRVINIFPNSNDIKNKLELIQQLLSIENTMETPITKFWNTQIDNLVKDMKFQSNIKQLHDLTTSEGILKTVLLKVVSKLGSEINELKPEHFVEVINEFRTGSRYKQLCSLSVLELGLLIAMYQHFDIFDGQPFNMEMIFDRYERFAVGATTLKAPKIVISKAFEHLRSLELIAPVGSHSSATPTEYRLFTLALRPQNLKEVMNTLPLPTELIHWFQTNI